MLAGIGSVIECYGCNILFRTGCFIHYDFHCCILLFYMRSIRSTGEGCGCRIASIFCLGPLPCRLAVGMTLSRNFLCFGAGIVHLVMCNLCRVGNRTSFLAGFSSITALGDALILSRSGFLYYVTTNVTGELYCCSGIILCPCPLRSVCVRFIRNVLGILIILTVNRCGIGVSKSFYTVTCLRDRCHRAGADVCILPYTVKHMILQFYRNSVQSSLRVICRMGPYVGFVAAQCGNVKYFVCVRLIFFQFIRIKALATVDARISCTGIPVAIVILGVISLIKLDVSVTMSRGFLCRGFFRRLALCQCLASRAAFFRCLVSRAALFRCLASRVAFFRCLASRVAFFRCLASRAALFRGLLNQAAFRATVYRVRIFRAAFRYGNFAVAMLCACQMRHLNGADNVSTPHELIVIVGVIAAGVVGVVVRIVICFCKLVSVATVIFHEIMDGSILISIIALTGCKTITGSDRNIHLAVILDGHVRNRRIFYGNGVFARSIIGHGEAHAAQCYRQITLSAYLGILNQLLQCTGIQIIRQDAVGKAEIYLAVIICCGNCDGRILLCCLCIFCIQLCNHCIIFHCLGSGVVNLTIVKIDQCYKGSIRICQHRIVINDLQLGIAKDISIRIVCCSLRASFVRIRAGAHDTAGLIHDIQHIRGIVQIICTAINLICLALDKRNPCILIGGISCDILVQCNNVGKISIIQLPRGRVAEHEIQMVHVAVCLNAVAVHAFNIDIRVAGIHIVPLAICLYCIPVVRRIKVTRLAKHGRFRIINNFYLVNDGSTVCTPDTVTVFIGYRRAVLIQLIVEFLIGFPVGGCVQISAFIQIYLRESALNKIGICAGIAEANRALANKCTNLRAFPQACDSIGSRSCLLRTIAVRIIGLIVHIAVSLCICNCLCRIFIIRILYSIINLIIYLLPNHIVHGLTCNRMELALSRLRCFYVVHNRSHGERAVICQPVIQCQILLNVSHIVIQRCQSLISYLLDLVAKCLRADFGSHVVDLYQTCHGVIVCAGFRNACNIQQGANRICIGVLGGIISYLNAVNIRMILKRLHILCIQTQQVLCLLIRQIVYVGFFLQLVCCKSNPVVHRYFCGSNRIVGIGLVCNLNQIGQVVLFQYLFGCGVHFLRRNTVFREICGVVVVVKDCIFNC